MAILDSTPVPLSATDLTQQVVYKYIAQKSEKVAKKFAKEVEMSPPQASGLPTVKQIMDVYHKDHKKKKPAQGSEDEEESSEEEEEEEKKTPKPSKKRKLDEEEENNDDESDEETYTKIKNNSAAKKDAGARSANANWAKKAKTNDQRDPTDAGHYLSNNKCFNCDEFGHFSRDCPTSKGASLCFVCKKEGHLSRECPDKPPSMCYNCNTEGHMSRDCPEPQTRPCYNCQTPGHIARDCPEPQALKRPRGGRGREGGRGRSMNVSRPSLGRGGPRGGRGGGGRSFKKDWGTGANDIPLGAKKTTTEGAAAE